MPAVLITGANRGIGAGFVDGYLEKGYTVIAAVRDPNAMAPRDNVIPVKIDAASEVDAAEAVKVLRERGISSIDIVIANAGTHGTNDKLKDVPTAVMRECWTINTIGPLVLYQAMYPLIPASGKFVIISSYRGKLDQEHETNEGAYGHSKAAANYLVSKIHSEEPFVTLAFNPGWVQTPMGDQSAQWAGIGDKAPQKVEDVIGSMIQRIDEAKKDTTSGKLWQWDGSPLGW